MMNTIVNNKLMYTPAYCGVTKCTYVQIISGGDGDEQVVCDKINNYVNYVIK